MSFPVLSSKTRSYLKATCVFECFTLLPWERPLATTLVDSSSLSLSLLLYYSFIVANIWLPCWRSVAHSPDEPKSCFDISLWCYAFYSYRSLSLSLLFLVSPGVTILLSLTVFLNLVAETLPQVSDAIPLLGMLPIPSILCIPHSTSFVFSIKILPFCLYSLNFHPGICNPLLIYLIQSYVWPMGF